MSHKALSREQMKAAIEHGGYLPQTIGLWISPDTYTQQFNEAQVLLNEYPMDTQLLIPTFPGYDCSPLPDHPEYVWGGHPQSTNKAIDSQQWIADWDDLDSFIENMPKASLVPITKAVKKAALEDTSGRYRLCHFWYFFYERLWSFRGMENALCDLYTNPEEIKILFGALCDFYIGVIGRMCDEIGCDGVYTTDDLGTQRSLMFSPVIFRELFAPFYRRVVDYCHQRGLHFWFHTCGNVECILPDLIDIGVDIIHPIQKFTMDEAAIAEHFGGQICFMCGMDVQQTMPFGTPEDVRAEVRRLVDIYRKDGGRMILSMGNGVTPNIPIENLRALYDELYKLR